MTDTERIDWFEKTKMRVCHVPIKNVFLGWRDRYPNGYWRLVFGPKDDSNRFQTLRELIDANTKP